VKTAPPSDITRLLNAARDGDEQALRAVFPLVYEEIRERAHRQRQRWHGDVTLNTTALVHEAYIKLTGHTDFEWEGRAHFLGVAAKAMRHILVDYARQRRAEKRGGDVQRISFEEWHIPDAEFALTDEKADSIVALEDALLALEQVDEREARVVECRFFGGLSVEETAKVLGISERTVKRDWAMAQAWLMREMKRG